jgi:DNA-binding protein HU-beta
MAAKKKVKKAAKAARAKKALPRKSKKAAKTRKARKTKAPAKKAVKAAARKTQATRAPAKKTIKARKAAATKKPIMGEGDYAASERFRKDETSFVEKNKAKIAGLGKAAEKALEGPEGDALRDAEATAAARSRDIF